MKKKIIMSLALAVALFVSNTAVVLAINPSQDHGVINGVTVTGNSSAYVASGSSSTYMATYCPMVTVSVDAEYKGVDRDTGNTFVIDSSSAGESSVYVIITPPYEHCETIDLMADHYAPGWHGQTYALFW